MISLINDFFSEPWSLEVSWIVITLIIIWFFRKITASLDDDLSDADREKLTNSLKEISGKSWLNGFKKIFDKFFGEKHFTPRCFLFSSLISIFIFFWISNLLSYGYAIRISDYTFLMLFGVNIIPDYFSLLQTRYFLNLRINIIIKLLLDAVFTFLIIFLWILLLEYVFGYSFYPGIQFIDQLFYDSLSAKELLKNHVEIYMPENGDPVFIGEGTRAILEIQLSWVYPSLISTTFFTSIWVWYHGISSLTINLLSSRSIKIDKLNIENKPYRATGNILNFYVLLTSVFLYLIFILPSSIFNNF